MFLTSDLEYPRKLCRDPTLMPHHLTVDTHLKLWLFLATQFESRFKGLVGTAYKLKATCATLGYQRTPGLAACRELLT